MASSKQKGDSDSEDDTDYIPPVKADPESTDDDEPDTKRARTNSLPLQQDEPAKKSRDALWSSFQASLHTPPPSTTIPAKKRIMIEKRYRFAGEDIVEVVEVDADSPDVKKWPEWTAPATSPPMPAAPGNPNSSTMDEKTGSIAPAKRPGPRKSRVSLAALPTPTSKAKKLSTLDKSAMDWQAHIKATEDSGLKDELEANRRSGGYLEKVEFLKRVDERKEDAIEASKGSKRRRL